MTPHDKSSVERWAMVMQEYDAQMARLGGRVIVAALCFVDPDKNLRLGKKEVQELVEAVALFRSTFPQYATETDR